MTDRSSALFCRVCGCILDLPRTDACVACDVCGTTVPSTIFETHESVTTTRPKPTPAYVRTYEGAHHTFFSFDRPKGATVKEKCTRCGNNEMVFNTLQLRSADEGQTVFYECTKCGYKYSTNT